METELPTCYHCKGAVLVPTRDTPAISLFICNLCGATNGIAKNPQLPGEVELILSPNTRRRAVKIKKEEGL